MREQIEELVSICTFGFNTHSFVAKSLEYEWFAHVGRKTYLGPIKSIGSDRCRNGEYSIGSGPARGEKKLCFWVLRFI